MLSITKYNFDDLVPHTSAVDTPELIELAAKQKESQGMDALPYDLYELMLENCLQRKDFRSTFWITTMANFGLRHSDVARLRHIDFIDENDHIREQILVQEHKTSKQRVLFINDAVRMALLMHLWNGEFQRKDYLIQSDGRRKGYETETYIDENGKEKVLRCNGRIIYKYDENGEKIPKPLSRSQSENIMKNILIENLNVALKNDKRCRNRSDCIGKINTHSIRKLYAWAVTQTYVRNFDSDIAYAHAAALSFLAQDFGHSSTSMTLHYSKDFDAIKKQINLSMNLGADVLEKYFREERQKWLMTLNSKNVH